MRQTIPRRTPTRYFKVSGGADRDYTLLKGDLEVVAAKGNLIIPRRNSTTGCSFMSYPGQIIIMIIIIIIIIIIKVNSDRKALKYNPLHQSLRSTYRQINFINLSLGALGTLGSSSDSFSELLKAVDFDSKMQKAILSRIMNITIRCTYYIFCCRNKPWTSPKLHGT